MAKILDMRSEQREILARIVNAQEKVQTRLLRVSRLLREAGIPYAVIGGNAVAAWVATRDESLVRATRDVDILISRDSLEEVRFSLEADGFIFRHSSGVDMFLDEPGAKAGDAVHILYSDEKVMLDHPTPAPSVLESVDGPDYRIASLEALVRMKLASWRDKDRVHLRDMIGVDLLDSTWPSKFQEPLRGRLQELIDNPE